mgnify:CR=1 FL=1
MCIAQVDTVVVHRDSTGNVKNRFELQEVEPEKGIPLEAHLQGIYGVAYFDGNEHEHYKFKVAAQFRFENYFQTGKWTSYYPNGQTGQVIHFQNGRVDGNYQLFDTNGTVLVAGRFDLDAKVGEWSYYHPNGKMQAQGSYFPDVRIYRPLAFINKDSTAVYGRNRQLLNTYGDGSDELSQLLRDLEFPDRTAIQPGPPLPYCQYFKTGQWRYWNEQGQLIRVEYWKEGQLEKKEEMPAN